MATRIPLSLGRDRGMGLATHRTPVLVELKPGESPVRIKQYPMSQEARKGIQPHIQRLGSLGVLVPCQSAWNTPLLPVKKPHTNDYRPVQDLREVNKRVTDIHPTVPNPYTLLSSLAPSRVWYTVLDLKDTFFSLPLAPQSQPLFAFEWHDPEEGYSGQLTWTRLPQGFKNSPTIFDEALHEDLGEYRREHPGLTLLQYVADILIAADMAKDCERGTQDLLATLGALGYRASTKKAQIYRKRVLHYMTVRESWNKYMDSGWT
uniref:Reverse transcriptase domain-containing protein n=1 Tax=Felis catus TaxID=9685 RepID=A0ABI7WHC8_FELCA